MLRFQQELIDAVDNSTDIEIVKPTEQTIKQAKAKSVDLSKCYQAACIEYRQEGKRPFQLLLYSHPDGKYHLFRVDGRFNYCSSDIKNMVVA